MSSVKYILSVFFLLGWFILPTSAVADEPVVRAVLFWSSTCPHCHYVLEEVLPPLQQKYGHQLDILMVEVKTRGDFERLLETAKTFGIPPEYVGVPFMIVGDTVLIGSDQIPAELPGLIEEHLAAGGLDYPAMPGLSEVLPTATPAVAAQMIATQPAADPPTELPQALATASIAETPQPEDTATPAAAAQLITAQPAAGAPSASPRASVKPPGFELAIAIMIGMVVALVYTGVAAVKGFQDASTRPTPPWLDLAIPVLAIAGLGVAAYLAYVETQAVAAVCGPVGDCNAVQSSPYARLFGLLPIGVLGAIGYLAILVAWLWGRLKSAPLTRHAPLVIFGLALVGTLFSLYLTYLEPFVIKAVCIWCLTSAIIITLLMLLSHRPAFQAMNIHKS